MGAFWGEIGNQLNGIVGSVFTAVAASLAGYLAALIAAIYTLYFVVVGARAATGQEPDLPAMVWRISWVLVVGALATSASFVAGPAFEVFDSVRGGIASAFVSGGAIGAEVNPSDPWTAIDNFAQSAYASMEELRVKASSLNFYELPEYLNLMLAYVLIGISTGVLQLISAFLVGLGTFLGAFGLAIAPLPILALAFAPTRSYFMSWLSFMFNVAMLSGVSMFSLAISIKLSHWFADHIADKGGILEGPTDFLMVALMWSFVHMFLAVLVYQGPSITAQLTGGAAFGQGGGLVHSVMRHFTRQQNNSGAATGVGTVSRPSRLRAASEAAGYAAGRATSYVYQRIAASRRA